MEVELLVGTIAAMLVFAGVAVLLLARAKVRVPPGGALVIFVSGREPRVTFSDAIVLPVVARAEAIDCSSKTISIVREGRDALRCYDNLRVDIRAEARLAVSPTHEDVLKVMRAVGAKSGDLATLRELFEAQIAEGIASAVRFMTIDDLTRKRDELRDRAIEMIGKDLNGWVLQDLCFVRIDQVPLEQLDPNNVLDAEAIRRIHERVAEEQRRTHLLRLDEQREAAQRAIMERQYALDVEGAQR